MTGTQRLDVLIPTHNRAPRLERCIRSVLSAHAAPTLDVHITVICNACSDGSTETVRRLQAAFPRRISLVQERRRGKSRALNAGIVATYGDLVGMIDDDEEVDSQWLQVIEQAFQDPGLDFIGGPYVPVWGAPAPDWLPDDYLAVLGAVDNGNEARPFDRDFPGILKGGNAVIRRPVLMRVGPYAHYLGPGSFARLFSCEDEDMYWRLLKAAAKGKYLPALVIYHHIDELRLTREYYRSWCFWRGASRGLMDRRHPLPVAYLAGVPRFLWGQAVRSAARMTLSPKRRTERDAFADELRIWDVAGYFYGRHIYAMARFSPVHSRRAKEAPTFAAIEKQVRAAEKVELAG